MLAVPPAPRQWSERSRQLNAILQRPGAAAALRLVRARVCPDQAGRPIDSSAGIDLALALLWTLPTTRLALSPPDRAALARVPDLMLHEADYAPIRNVQRGGPGLVDLVRSRHDGCVYVLKSTLKGAAARESYRINPLIEKRIFLQALAPCAQRHGLSEHHDSSQAREDLPIPRLHAAFQSRAATHLVIEYCPAGDLESLLASAGAANSCYPGRSSIPGGLLSESWVLAYGKDICSAVAWLHDLGFAHRDIKPANFLLHSSGHLKMCDFGTAAPFSLFDVPSGKRRRLVHHSFCQKPAGTCDYIAPEILLHQETKLAWGCTTQALSPSADVLDASARQARAAAPDDPGAYGPEVDWWSVGVVLYELAYGALPFWAVSPAEAWYRIRNHEEFLQLDPGPTSAELRSLLAGLMSSAPQRLGRDGSLDVLRHPAFGGSNPAAWKADLPPFKPVVDEALLAPDASCVFPSRSPCEATTGLFDRVTEEACLSITTVGTDGPGYLTAAHEAPMADTSLESIAPVSDVDVEADDEHEPLEVADYAWVGFTHCPEPSCFQTARADAWTHTSTSQDAMPSLPSQTDLWTPEVQPLQKDGLGPLVSTPFTVSGVAGQTTRFTASTPAGGTDTLDTSMPPPLESNRFSTPARKAAPPAVGSVPPSGIPPSPYPFPQITPALPLNCPMRGAGKRASPVLAMGWDSSASCARGVGSDTRCSGGSNAKRSVSESQAWNEMMKAVHQSARKRRQGQGWTPVRCSQLQPPSDTPCSRLTDVAQHHIRGPPTATGSGPAVSFAAPRPAPNIHMPRKLFPSLASSDAEETGQIHAQDSQRICGSSPVMSGDTSHTSYPTCCSWNERGRMQLNASPPTAMETFSESISWSPWGHVTASRSVSLLPADNTSSSESDSGSGEDDWISASPSAARTRLTGCSVRPGTVSDEASGRSDCASQGARSIRLASLGPSVCSNPIPGGSSSLEELNESSSSPAQGIKPSLPLRRADARKNRTTTLPFTRRLFTKTASMSAVPQMCSSPAALSPNVRGGFSTSGSGSGCLQASSTPEGRLSPGPMPFVGHRSLSRAQSETPSSRSALPPRTTRPSSSPISTSGVLFNATSATPDLATGAPSKSTPPSSASFRPRRPLPRRDASRQPRSVARPRPARSQSLAAPLPPSRVIQSDPDESLSFVAAWASNKIASLHLAGPTETGPATLVPSSSGFQQTPLIPSALSSNKSSRSSPPRASHQWDEDVSQRSLSLARHPVSPKDTLTAMSALCEHADRELRSQDHTCTGLQTRLRDVHLSAAGRVRDASPDAP